MLLILKMVVNTIILIKLTRNSVLPFVLWELQYQYHCQDRAQALSSELIKWSTTTTAYQKVLKNSGPIVNTLHTND